MLAAAPVLLVTAVPLAVDSAAQLLFHPVKWLLVCLLVPAGLAVAAAFGALRWPAPRWWALWLAVLAAAALVGVAPRISVFGAPQRNVGLVAWAVAGGAFVLGASAGGSAAVLRWTVRAAFLGGGLVGVGAVLDQAGVDVFGLGDLDSLTRSRSTWGSATFTAGHLVLVGPLAFLHLAADDRRWRVMGAVAGAVMVTGLVMTGTRGAWLGAVVAVVVVAWPHRSRAPALWPAVVAVVVAVGVVAAVSSPSLGRSTAAGRLDLWRVATDAAWDRPILGAGPDTQRIVMPAAIDEDFEREHGSEELHDRAHSLLLDTALTSGVLGVAALIVLLLAVARLLVAAARTGPVGRALAAGCAGYLVHLQFAFSEASLDPLAWLLAGTAATVGASRRPASARRRPIFAGAFAVAAVAGLLWAGGELVAEHRLRRALDLRAEGRAVEAFDALAHAPATAPARFDILQARARLSEELHNGGFVVDLEETGLADIEAALEVGRRDPDLLIDRASLLGTAGRVEESAAAYDFVLAGPYPNSSRAWLGAGVTSATAGDEAAAQRAWERAADLAPTDERPWINLGRLHERAGRKGQARHAFERVLQIEPASQEAQAALARLG